MMQERMRAMCGFVERAVLVVVAIIVCAGGALAEPMEFVINGVTRTALLERSATAPEPQPTIVMLHEAGGKADVIANNSRLARLAPQEGFVAVFPQSLGPWNALPPGVELPGFRNLPDDAGFLKTLVADLVRRRISDPERVYLAGVSLGGFMALRMVCLDTEQFAGAALFTAAMADLIGDRCRPTKPVAFLLMNGTADRNVPYQGGPLGNTGVSMWPAERLLEFFRKHNRCANVGKQSAQVVQSHKIEIEYATCSDVPVANYRIIGGGHSVPWAMDIGRFLWRFFTGKLAP